jgi:hypothetical protein
MRALQSETHEDGVADGPEVVQLPMHVGERGTAILDWVVPIPILIGDFHGFVDEYAVVVEE